MERYENITADQWRHLSRSTAATALRENPSISDDLTVAEIRARLSALAGSPGERLATWAVLRHHAPERFPGARNSIHHAAKTLGKAGTPHTVTGIEKLSRMLVTNPGILASQITRLECISIMHKMAPIERMAMLLEVWNTQMRNESRESVKSADWRHSYWRGLLALDTALHKAMRGEASRASVTGQIHLVEIANAHPETLATLVGKDIMSKVLGHQALDYANRRNASDRIEILARFRPKLAPFFGRTWESAITAQALRLVLEAPEAAGGDTGPLEELLDTWKDQPDPPAIDPDAWSDVYQTVSTSQRMVLMLHLDAVCMLEAPAPISRTTRSVE